MRRHAGFVTVGAGLFVGGVALAVVFARRRRYEECWLGRRVQTFFGFVRHPECVFVRDGGQGFLSLSFATILRQSLVFGFQLLGSALIGGERSRGLARLRRAAGREARAPL